MVQRTVWILPFAESAYQAKHHLLPFSLKFEKKSEVSTTIEVKASLLSACIDAILGYCRKVWDLFPEEKRISVITTGKKLICHNNWNNEEQCIQKIMEGFEEAKPSKEPNLREVLEWAVHHIADNRFSSSHVRGPHSVRIIVILPPSLHKTESIEGLEQLLSQWIARENESLEERQISIDSCEVVFVKIVDESRAFDPNPPSRKISPTLRSITFEVEGPHIDDFFSELIRTHLNLQKVRVEGIPMKQKESSAQTRSMYHVELVYSTPNDGSPCGLRDWRRVTHPPDLLLRWKSVDRKTNADTLPSKAAFRVTPTDPTTSPTICLMKHVVSDCKPVALITVNPNDPDIPIGLIPSTSPLPVTHSLLAHGEYLYLHILRQSSLSLLDLPLSIYSENVSEYRTKDFGQLIDANILRMPKEKKDNNVFHLQNGSFTTNILELRTRYFPLNDNETLLFSQKLAPDAQSLLGPVKDSFLSGEDMEDDELETCIALVSRFHKSCTQNEQRLFPTILDPSSRIEAYRKLWIELYKYLNLCASSNSHNKVIQTMESLWPDLCSKATIRKGHTSLEPEKQSTNANLYPNLELKGTGNTEEDLWNQYEQAKKQSEEDHWKTRDATQQPVREMETAELAKSRSEKKRTHDEINLKECDKSSILYQYLLAKQSKKPSEFDGRLTGV